MKYKVHVPVEQYGFVEAEFEYEVDGEIESAKVYRDIARAHRPQNGLGAKEWREALDSLNLGSPLPVEAFEGMSEAQRWAYHQQELSIKRISGIE